MFHAVGKHNGIIMHIIRSPLVKCKNLGNIISEFLELNKKLYFKSHRHHVGKVCNNLVLCL